MKLTVSGAAVADLERLRTFLAGKSVNAARRAVDDIVRAIDSLTVFPDRGHPAGVAGLRDLRVPFGRSGYIIRFVHDAERAEIVVMRIWHDRECGNSPKVGLSLGESAASVVAHQDGFRCGQRILRRIKKFPPHLSPPANSRLSSSPSCP